VKLVSTCRPLATIANSGRASRQRQRRRFRCGQPQGLIPNHHDGGTMTYVDIDDIHIDIGPHFVSISGGQHWASWCDNARAFPGRTVRTSCDD
jgi:hypothetical protein